MPFISMCLTTLRWQNQCSRSLLRHCLHLIGRNRIQCEEHQHSCEIFNRFIFASFIATCLLLIPIPLPLSRAIVCSVTFGPTHQMREKKNNLKKKSMRTYYITFAFFPMPSTIRNTLFSRWWCRRCCCSAALLFSSAFFLKKNRFAFVLFISVFRLRSPAGMWPNQNTRLHWTRWQPTLNPNQPKQWNSLYVCIAAANELHTHRTANRVGWKV